MSNLNNFHSLEVVDRVSETQLQVGENSNIFLRIGRLMASSGLHKPYLKYMQRSVFEMLSKTFAPRTLSSQLLVDFIDLSVEVYGGGGGGD